MATLSVPLTSGRSDVTRLLIDWRNGSEQAVHELMPLVYHELKRLAGAHLRSERPGHTLQATALVHEAFLRLVGQRHLTWENRAHFFGLASEIIRRVLVDYVRVRNAAKRGSGSCNLALNEALGIPVQDHNGNFDLEGLDKALNQLAAIDPQQARIIELRFFGGLTVEETARVVGISPASVYREWNAARAWLFRKMKGNNRG